MSGVRYPVGTFPLGTYPESTYQDAVYGPRTEGGGVNPVLLSARVFDDAGDITLELTFGENMEGTNGFILLDAAEEEISIAGDFTTVGALATVVVEETISTEVHLNYTPGNFQRIGAIDLSDTLEGFTGFPVTNDL